MKSKEERSAIFVEINSMTRSLPLNPDRIGITSLFELSSVFTTYRERISAIVREAIDDVTESNKAYIIAKENLRIKSNEILNRDEIKILKPIAVQQAACEIHLTPHNKAVLDAELTRIDADAFLTKVRMAQEDIKDKIRTIRTQVDINGQLIGHSPMNAGNDPFGKQKGASLS